MSRSPTVTLANGVAISYAERGDRSDPTLVLVPGPTDSWRSYEPVLELLPRSCHAIALSQRGHGDSDKPPHGYRIDDFAADLLLLLESLGIAHAVLAGHSGSCLVVRRVALDHPERVTGLVLEASPTTLRGNDALQNFVDTVVSGLRDPIDPDFARSFVADTSSDAVASDVVESMAHEVLKVPARVWHESFSALLQYDDSDALGSIRAPTLLVWGDADDVVPRAMQDELTSRIPGAELRIYTGVGHAPRWEDPQRFAADLAAFMQRLTPPAG